MNCCVLSSQLIGIKPQECHLVCSIVTAVIGMGRNLKLRVVAEDVETQQQLAFLQANECDEAQEYYFSRPVLPQQFAIMLRNGIPESSIVA